MTDDDREGSEPGSLPDDAATRPPRSRRCGRTVEKQGGQIGAEMTVIRRGGKRRSISSRNTASRPTTAPTLARSSNSLPWSRTG